ncbi:TetR/AcrR family transcriptional regulator [Paenibacillus flagellatus]|uniref:TetR family transcriptional regulator n=1 Tax=Paenibacillus flagellatus TaxID=2211139 RepID=A0A2V5KQN2_9BACL|nr:TetR/AcrR family transcriptional regulator [Paenibacillus flagellatus]PYI50986.1 TetR family transcriptional regulator [Paenibacillus flagellatus]
MREHTTDLRVVRTQQAIRDALVELIEEKGFEAMTVKDITTRARINRGTFYAHYLDKYDLMAKCEEEIMVRLSKLVKKTVPSVTAEMRHSPPRLAIYPLVVTIFEFLNEHSRFMKAALGPQGDMTFHTRFKDFFRETMLGKSPDVLINEEECLVPAKYFATYVGSAHIGVIQQWLESGMQESPEEMARILTTILVHGPLYAAGLKKLPES